MTETDLQLFALNKPPHVLLELAIIGFNKLSAESDENEQQNLLLTSQLNAYKNQANEQHKQLNKLQAELDALTTENAAYKKQESDVETVLTDAHRAVEKKNKQITALQRELTHAKNQLKATQQQYNEANPRRLKEQIKRLKEQNEKLTLRNKKQTQEAAEYRKEITHYKTQIVDIGDKLFSTEKRLAFSNGTGLYHNGSHHVIYWPQQTKMQREDGTTYASTSLLYMDQSGRGAIISRDPEKGAQLCAAPKGGLRPNKETLDFVEAWLYKVNELQNGEVLEEDMIPVNHNY
jgi:predicted  nucleic acid-binding Zn-ribbon protein